MPFFFSSSLNFSCQFSIPCIKFLHLITGL
nr:MAG TPA: hypothetical protein [Caudoviricetes sp.]